MNRHAMVIRADARAMGAVTALTVGGTRKSRTTSRALSDCVVYASRDDYDAGNVQRIIPRTTRNPRSSVPRVAPVYYAPEAPHRITAADLPALNCD